MVVLRCTYSTECTFATEDVDVAAAILLLDIHARAHPQAIQQGPAPQPTQSRGPKLVRPTIKLNSSPEDWNAFTRRWAMYKAGSNISDNDAPGQLLECTSEDLGNIVLRAHPNFTSKPLDEVITLLRSLAVVPIALGVLRSELSAMVQDPDEPFRTFAARVQGKAETCEFTTSFSGACAECSTPYDGSTYYTDDRIRDVLLNGIADVDIRREALSVDGILRQSINDIIGFVEGREIARNANPVLGISAVSGYRKNQRSNNSNNNSGTSSSDNWSGPSAANRVKTAPCPDCQQPFHLFSRGARGWNKRPHDRCQPCWKRNRDRQQTNGNASAISASTNCDPFGQLSSITAARNSEQPDEHAAVDKDANLPQMRHHPHRRTRR